MNGPPDERNRPVPSEAASTTPTNETVPLGKRLCWVPCTRQYPQDLRSQLSRRRSQALRSLPLDCGCRDPWPCTCTQPPLSDRAIDGYRDAAEHILATGQTPILPLEVRRALWRRGGHDRELAELLHKACGEVVA